jgi:hypothetical protein
MDVKLQQVEESIVYFANGTVDLLFNTEKEFKRPACLIACRERYVRQLAGVVCYVLAGVAGLSIRPL